MAQPKLDYVSLELAAVLADAVATSSTGGDIYDAASRLKAINLGRGNVYNKILHELGEKRFMELYPEFIGKGTKTISPKDGDIRKVIKAYYNSKILEPVPPEQMYEAANITYSAHYASSTYPRFIEYDDKVELLGIGTSPSTCDISYLKQPLFIAGYGGSYPDLIEPWAWLDEIVLAAEQIILHGQQEN